MCTTPTAIIVGSFSTVLIPCTEYSDLSQLTYNDERV